MAIPTSGYLIGLVTVMALTGGRFSSLRIWPKLVGAAVTAVIGVTFPLGAAAVGCALVLAALAMWMILSGNARSQQSAGAH